MCFNPLSPLCPSNCLFPFKPLGAHITDVLRWLAPPTEKNWVPLFLSPVAEGIFIPQEPVDNSNQTSCPSPFSEPVFKYQRPTGKVCEFTKQLLRRVKQGYKNFYWEQEMAYILAFKKISVGSCLVAKSCLTLWRPHGLKTSRLLCPWNFPGKNTEAGCHFLLQRIFPIQGWNLCLLH